jgi:exonuclease SbcD
VAIKLLHAADLHLTARPEDADYCLQVWRDVVATAAAEQCDALLLAGDVFDTPRDVEAMRSAFRDALNGFGGDVIYVPGNHEDKGDQFAYLQRFDFGTAKLAATLPFGFQTFSHRGHDWELLTIPHQNTALDPYSWVVPAKAAKHRVAIAHGTVTGMAYAGPDAEEGGAALDGAMFVALGVDYAALGHIHGRREQVTGGTTIAYAGSTRVWRSGERGAHGVNIVELSDRVTVRFVPLAVAGEYRRVEVPLSPDGTPEAISTNWNKNDHVELRLSGLIDDETSLATTESELKRAHGATARRLDVKRGDVTVLGGIAEDPFAKQFLARMVGREPTPDAPNYDRELRRWLKARDIVLTQMKAAQERRS